jgi:hypothetical protein
MLTVDFVNADDVVEKRLRLDENAEYMCLQSVGYSSLARVVSELQLEQV